MSSIICLQDLYRAVSALLRAIKGIILTVNIPPTMSDFVIQTERGQMGLNDTTMYICRQRSVKTEYPLMLSDIKIFRCL